MNIEEVINNLKNYISFSEKECNFPSIYDWNWNMDLANDIETLLTAYEKEKDKNKNARERIEYYLVGNFALNDFDERNKELRKIEEILEE